MGGLMFEKDKPYRNPKIRKAARGEACTMNSPLCNYNPETTVLCHSNSKAHGKGMGQKGDDSYAFFGCSGCHDWFDGRAGNATREEKDALFTIAMKRTQQRLEARKILNKGGIR